MGDVGLAAIDDPVVAISLCGCPRSLELDCRDLMEENSYKLIDFVSFSTDSLLAYRCQHQAQ